MKIFKGKTEDSVPNKATVISPVPANTAVTVEGVFYHTDNPNSYLILLDGDGDQFTFPIPGQADPKPVNFAYPLTVKGPIYYMDTIGGHKIIVWGTQATIETRVPSSFSPPVK